MVESGISYILATVYFKCFLLMNVSIKVLKYLGTAWKHVIIKYEIKRNRTKLFKQLIIV